MIIRGFSYQTVYDCVKCRSVCCTTDYDLPLCGTEGSVILQEYPKYKFCFQTTSKGSKILRGDACPFFSRSGKCDLHETSFKPLACQIYPLIFWKFNQKDILVWINPCRGKGFQWYSFDQKIIEDSEVNILLEISDKYYDSYFGEEIDQNNPFAEITEKRVLEQWDVFQSIKEGDLLETMIERVNYPPYSKLYNSPELNPYFKMKNYPLTKALNAVLNWLIWSPVGLSLSLQNLQVISTVAALWIFNTTLENINSDQSLLKDSHYIQQVSSFYTTAILPSYWINIYRHTASQELRSFAKQTQLVLAGKIPQQQLENFDQF